METKVSPILSRTYRILGKNEDCKIEIGKNGTVHVQVGRSHAIIPIDCAIALQSQDARDYLSDPTIAAFLYNARDLVKQRAAWDLSRPNVVDNRRAFKSELMAAGFSDADAAWLAVLKFP